jgi:hypothetical protein
MICFVLLCTYVRISSTQPLLNSDDDEDQAEVYEPFLNNLIIKSGRFPPNNPESLYDYHEEQQPQLFHQNKQYHPDNLQLAKRIIMLPRVGRRSIRSSSRK